MIVQKRSVMFRNVRRTIISPCEAQGYEYGENTTLICQVKRQVSGNVLIQLYPTRSGVDECKVNSSINMGCRWHPLIVNMTPAVSNIYRSNC